jgi:NADP-dependent 3-hydroxy acid dehydrogenase YdfG
MAQFMLNDAHTAQTSLKGKKVAITGGTTGIGRATAVLLASEGAKVFICGRNPDYLEDALKRIGEVGEGDGISIDLAERGSPERFFEAANDYLGGIDVAVINAAIPADGLSVMEAEDVRYAIATDFTAYIMSAHAAYERMAAGEIILIGSMSAHHLGPNSTVYAGIKAGVAGFAEALRKELGSKGIKVSLIEPGLVGADFHYPEIPADKQVELINKEKMLRAEDIAVGIHYLLTQPSRTVVQQLVIVPRVQDE